MLLCFCYLSKEFNCDFLYSNNAHSVRYRLFISNIQIEITEVDYLGRYQLGSKSKGSEEKAGICFHRISTFQMNVLHISDREKRR